MRRFLTFPTLLLVLALIGLPVLAAPPVDIVPELPAVIYRDDGSAAVPLAPMAALLQATLEEQPGGEFRLSRNGITFSCRLDSADARLGETPCPLPFTPYEQSGVAYVPLVSVMEAFGGTGLVDFPTETATVTLPGRDPISLHLQASSGGHHLFLLGLDGRVLKRLTYDSEVKWGLQSTRKGDLLAYLVESRLYFRRLDSPYRISLEPALSEWRCYYPAFHPDGSLILCSQNYFDDKKMRLTKSRVVIARTDGSGKTVLAEGESPHWGADGKVIFYTKPGAPQHPSQLCSMDITGKPICTIGEGDSRQFACTADGTHIAYTKDYPVPGQDGLLTGVIITELRDGKPVKTYESAPAERVADDYPLAFSPDGRELLVQRIFTDPRGLSRSELWTMHADGTGLRHLAMGRQVFHATYSPDGTQVYFVDDDGFLYRMQSDGSVITRISRQEYRVNGFTFTAGGESLVVNMMPREVWLPSSPPDALDINGVIMAPLSLVKLLGYADAIIELPTRVAVHTCNHTEFICRLGERSAKSKGTTIELPTAPVRVNGEIYCPLLPFMQALGNTVAVDAQRQVVTVSARDHEAPVRIEMPLITVTGLDTIGTGESRTELYVTLPNGTPCQRLTFDTEANSLPTFTPDGKAYVMTAHGKPAVRPTVYPLPPNPREILLAFDPKIPVLPGRTLTTTPDGRQRVLLRKTAIVVEGPEGTKARVLLDEEKLARPSFTLDGEHIVFLRNGSLYTMTLEGLQLTRLTSGLRVTNYTFSPTGLLFFIAEPVAGQ